MRPHIVCSDVEVFVMTKWRVSNLVTDSTMLQITELAFNIPMQNPPTRCDTKFLILNLHSDRWLCCYNSTAVLAR